MRIIGGRFRGRRLASFRGRQIRPLLDSAREAVFNILGGRFEGEPALDLFCGSGSFGLEALSRGAASCDFVEMDRYAVSVLRENVERLGVSEVCRIKREDAFRFVARRGSENAPGLVFLDPPFRLLTDAKGRGRVRGLFADSGLPSMLADHSVCLVHFEKGVWSEGFGEFLEERDVRDYGRSRIHFLRRARKAGSDHPPTAEEDL